MFKKQKKNYTSHLQDDLELHATFTTSIVFNTTNPYYLIREYLESHLPSNYHQSLRTQSYLK